MKQPLNSRLESWQAKLCLRADCPRGETRVRKLHQQGPLQIQKILYPEGPSIAHAFVLHPPSGIAQDDQLRIEISAVQESHSVYCAPGATRWYRSFPGAPRPAQQHILLNLSQRSSLEWLPFENLYFDQTWAQNTLEVRLEPGSCHSSLCVPVDVTSQPWFTSLSSKTRQDLGCVYRLVLDSVDTTHQTPGSHPMLPRTRFICD